MSDGTSVALGTGDTTVPQTDATRVPDEPPAFPDEIVIVPTLDTKTGEWAYTVYVDRAHVPPGVTVASYIRDRVGTIEMTPVFVSHT